VVSVVVSSWIVPCATAAVPSIKAAAKTSFFIGISSFSAVPLPWRRTAPNKAGVNPRHPVNEAARISFPTETKNQSFRRPIAASGR
jgi:hypothetical protein